MRARTQARTSDDEAHGLGGGLVLGGGAAGEELLADGREGLERQSDVLLALEAVEGDDGAWWEV